jgi:hypothetical protein
MVKDMGIYKGRKYWRRWSENKDKKVMQKR